MALEFCRKGWFSAPDIPFARDDANRYLPWIVAFMVCLTGLMLAVSLSMGMTMQRLSGNYESSFTLQIPASSLSRNFTAKTAIALLRGNEWAEDVREISREEMQSLIEPWMGSGAAMDTLPLPLLIEVKVREGTTVDIDALERRIAKKAPGASIDNYERWMTRFGRFSAGVQYVVFVLAMLMVATTLAVVVLAAKTALRLHQQTVEVLYTIGAEDNYIATQFQQNAMALVFRGAAAGSVAAALLLWIAQMATSAFDAPLLPEFAFSPAHILLFILLPLLTAGAALFSTRFAVLALLRRKP